MRFVDYMIDNALRIYPFNPRGKFRERIAAREVLQCIGVRVPTQEPSTVLTEYLQKEGVVEFEASEARYAAMYRDGVVIVTSLGHKRSKRKTHS